MSSIIRTNPGSVDLQQVAYILHLVLQVLWKACYLNVLYGVFVDLSNNISVILENYSSTNFGTKLTTYYIIIKDSCYIRLNLALSCIANLVEDALYFCWSK